MLVVFGEVVGDAGETGVHIGAAEFLGGHFLAGRGFHQRRAAEEDRAGALDDHRLVRHRRDVRTARGARSHDGGNLGDPLGRHARLVEEDAAEVLAVGEHVGLQRQEGASGVDQVDAGQAILERDLLSAQVLLDGDGVVGAAFHRRVVRDDQDFATRDAANPGHQPGARRLIVVHAERGQGRELEERRAAIEQAFDPLANRQLALSAMPLNVFRTAALAVAVDAVTELGDEVAQPFRVRLEHRIRGDDARLERLHLPAAAVGLVAAG